MLNSFKIKMQKKVIEYIKLKKSIFDEYHRKKNAMIWIVLIQEHDESSAIENDWKFAAMVLDR